jgi:hypothetical protein
MKAKALTTIKEVEHKTTQLGSMQHTFNEAQKSLKISNQGMHASDAEKKDTSRECVEAGSQGFKNTISKGSKLQGTNRDSKGINKNPTIETSKPALLA